MLICVACATPMFKAIKKAGNQEKEGSKLLNENLKFFRKKKGLTQADLLGASVSELMGGTIKDEKNENAIAQELSRINE